ncbi:MAG: hypothetical protein ABWZ82_10905 [Candidatus Limnocylindrales bacterium]|jgi:hypothetical protein
MRELLIQDAKRVATIATVILSVGWAGALLMVIYGVMAWIDFTGRESVGFLEGLIYAIDLFAAPFFLALVVAGIGHALRLFALYTVRDQA